MTDDTLDTDITEGPKLKGLRRGRRWSLDVISPKFTSWRRGSAAPESEIVGMTPRLSHLHMKDELSHHVFALFSRRHHRGPEKQVYAVLDVQSGGHLVVTAEDEAELNSLMTSAMTDGRISSYRLILASTKAFLRVHTTPSRTRSYDSLLQLQSVAEQAVAEIDERLSIVKELHFSETRYINKLQSLFDCYAEPLRKFSSLNKEDHRVLFMGLEPIFSISASLARKLELAIESWDPGTSKVGNLFSKKFWSIYEEYQDTYRHAKRFLEERLKNDKTFENFCDLRQQNGDLSLDTLILLPIQRIPDYDKYLSDLLERTDTNHADYDDLNKAVNKAKDVLKDREELRDAENDEKMENIQDRFPYDDLQLHDKDKGQKSRGLSVRRRSAPSAVVFKTLSGNRSRSNSSLWSQNNMGGKDGDAIALQTIKQAADSNRIYIMEGAVQFATGMQTQDRYLFLFNDLLLVAKKKSNTTFKLKVRVHLCDMWIATCVEDVSELTRPVEKSFVIGWPTCNVVATFKDTDTKETWLTKLTEQVNKDKLVSDLKEVQLKIVMKGDKSESCYVSVNQTTQARHVIQNCLEKFKIADSEAKDYKLWVWSGKDGSPYPLIGHEVPLSIKANQLRELARTSGHENMTLSEVGSNLENEHPNVKCDFFLQQKKAPRQNMDANTHKRKKLPLLNIFRRSPRDEKSGVANVQPDGKLFRQPLKSVCEPDNLPPKPIVDLLTILFREGPSTVGVLRKSANVKSCRELRERLDQGEAIDLNEQNALVIGTVIKEYLRCLPEALLQENLFDEWKSVPDIESEVEKINTIKKLLSQLPICNVQLLKRLTCALHQIQKMSHVNKMDSRNLSLCITPSLLWRRDNADLAAPAPDVAAPAPAVAFMIDHCVELFGEDLLHLLGDPPDFKSRLDSGTDSDSMHSILGMNETSNGLRCDDSSIDSLVERDYFQDGGESSPNLVKSHLSPSNLSRDSGLTLSDTQLYDDDVNESADHRGKDFIRSTSEHYTMEVKHTFDAAIIPVPPPRSKRGKRNECPGCEDDNEIKMAVEGGFAKRSARSTIHNSISSSRLFEQPRYLSGNFKTDKNRSVLSHPALVKRVSSESLSNVQERDEVMGRNDFHDLRKNSMDIGLIRKSASGAHLFLEDTTMSRRYSGDTSPVVRQSSGGVDSTPPLSPQSKYSYSSKDSVLSDSSCWSMSRENSVTSAPQTPDEEHASRWFSAMEDDSRDADSQRLDGILTLPRESPNSARNNLHLSSIQNVRHLVSPPHSPVHESEPSWFQSFTLSHSRRDEAFQVPPPSPWPGKSREAEEVPLSSSPQIHITGCSSSSDEKLDDIDGSTSTDVAHAQEKSFPLDIPSLNNVPYRNINKYSTALIKGSPPSQVLLNKVRSPRAAAPVRASYDSKLLAQIQSHEYPSGKSSTCAAPGKLFDATRSMDSINTNEYISVKPKLTYIHREESFLSTHSSLSSGSNSSSGNDTVTLSSASSSPSPSTSPLEAKRPNRPPCYDEAVQRNSHRKNDFSPEITRQREASERAKILYEESLQKFHEERYEKKHRGFDMASHASDKSGESGNQFISNIKEEVASSLGLKTQSDSDIKKTHSAAGLHLLSTEQSICQASHSPMNLFKEPSYRLDTHTKVVNCIETREHLSPTKLPHRTVKEASEFHSLNDCGVQKSSLDIPVSNLHRSLSDSSEYLNKLGHLNPRNCSLETCGREKVIEENTSAHKLGSGTNFVITPTKNNYRMPEHIIETRSAKKHIALNSTNSCSAKQHGVSAHTQLSSINSTNSSPAKQHSVSAHTQLSSIKHSYPIERTEWNSDNQYFHTERSEFNTTKLFSADKIDSSSTKQYIITDRSEFSTARKFPSSDRVEFSSAKKYILTDKPEFSTTKQTIPTDIANQYLQSELSKFVPTQQPYTSERILSELGSSRQQISIGANLDFMQPGNSPRREPTDNSLQAKNCVSHASSEIQSTNSQRDYISTAASKLQARHSRLLQLPDSQAGISESSDKPFASDMKTAVSNTSPNVTGVNLQISGSLAPKIKAGSLAPITIQGSQSQTTTLPTSVQGLLTSAGTPGSVVPTVVLGSLAPASTPRSLTPKYTACSMASTTAKVSVASSTTAESLASSAALSSLAPLYDPGPLAPKSAPVSQVPVSRPSSQAPTGPPSSNRTSTELPWSVQDLKKLYDSDKPSSVNLPSSHPVPDDQQLTASTMRSASLSSIKTSSSSVPRPGPPPYQDPPPFRRLQDNSRQSTSSNSSNGSADRDSSIHPVSKRSVALPNSRRLGPQNASFDYSSSDESCTSSRKSRGRSDSGSGLSDLELSQNYSDITYV